MILTEFFVFAGLSHCMKLECSWNVMAHGDAREGKWRGNWRMEWVASTLHTTSEHGVSSITTADAHTSSASSRLNWRPRRFKWTRPFRRKTKSGFSVCAITFQKQSTIGWCGKLFFLILFQGVRGGAVYWGAALQAGKVAGSIFDLGFFKDLILRATLLPCGRLNLWQKWVPVVSSRSKGRSLRGAGNIATFMCRLSRAGMANLWHSGRFSLELGFHCWPKLFLSNQRLYIVKNICLYLTS